MERDSMERRCVVPALRLQNGIVSSLDELRTRQDEILQIAAKHGAGNVRVFGSVARGDARPDSDVDFLIDIVGPTTPWFPGSLLADLEDALGRRVDIVIARSLSPIIRDSVLKDAIPLRSRIRAHPFVNSPS